MGLTGNFRFRKGLRRRAVLQVEEEVKPFWSKLGELKPRCRASGPARKLSSARTEVTSDGWLRVSLTASFSAPNAKLYLCVLDRHGASSFRPTSEALRIRGLQLTNGRVTSAEPSQQQDRS